MSWSSLCSLFHFKYLLLKTWSSWGMVGSANGRIWISVRKFQSTPWAGSAVSMFAILVFISFDSQSFNLCSRVHSPQEQLLPRNLLYPNNWWQWDCLSSLFLPKTTPHALPHSFWAATLQLHGPKLKPILAAVGLEPTPPKRLEP